MIHGEITTELADRVAIRELVDARFNEPE